jgi:hypothetical protein
MKSIRNALYFIFCFIFLKTIPAFSLDPFVLITMPKSGSHLMIKTLYLLTGSEAIWHTMFPSYQYVPPEHGFLYTHFCVSPQLENDYRDLGDLKQIILIRDLRDVAISVVHQIKKASWPGMTKKNREYFLKLPFDEQLLFVINFEYDAYIMRKRVPASLQVSISKVAEQAVSYMNKSNTLTCRYENIVGLEGGGTSELQWTELQKIHDFLNLDLPESQILDVCNHMYGDGVDPFGKNGFLNFQSTFRNGKIGSWRNYFTETHKAAFKKKLGHFLIALGYEKDNNW